MKFSWVMLFVVLCAVFSEGVMVRSRKAGEEKFPEPNAAGQTAPGADGQGAPGANGQTAPLPEAAVQKLDDAEANSASKPETFDASKSGDAAAAAESTTEVKVKVVTNESSTEEESSDESSSEEESSGKAKECKPFIAYGEALLKRANALLKEDDKDAKQITEEEFLKKITEEDGSDECYKDHYELIAVPDADADETSKEEKKEEEILLQDDEDKEPLAELSSVLVYKDENIPKTEKKYAIAVLKGVCEKEAQATELNLLQTKAADKAKAKKEKEESFGSNEEHSEEEEHEEETTEEHVTHVAHEEEDDEESEASEDKKSEVAHIEVQITTEDAHDELAELLSASYRPTAEDKFKFLYLDDGYVSITECITQAELPEWLGGEDTVTLEGVYVAKENDENDDKEEEEKEQDELKGLVA